MADNPEQSEVVSENEPTIAEQAPAAEATPEPKKRGRPAGAKDKAPRKPRTRIIEEPPTPPPTPAPPKAARAAKPREETRVEPPAREPTPMSPRTMFRVASDHIATLHSEREDRKAHV